MPFQKSHYPLCILLIAIFLFLFGPSNVPVHAAMLYQVTGPAALAQQTCSDLIGNGVAWLNKYNPTVLHDVTAMQTAQGRTFVGHDFVSGNSANFGIAISGPTDSCNGTALTVVHDILNGNPLNISKGGVLFGNSKGTRIIDFNNSQGCTASQDSTLTPAYAANVQSNLQAFSAQLATFSANNPAPARDNNFNITYVVNTVTAAGLAVFTLGADQAFPSGNTNTIDLANKAGASTILINVTGATVNFATGNLGSFFTANNSANSAKIIWNFPDATSVSFDRQFVGAVLAPKAVLQTQQSLSGSVVVNNLNVAGSIQPLQLALSNLGPLLDGCPAPASVKMTKLTNGVDANSATGPLIPVGNPVTWSYVFTNTGKVALNNFTLVDSKLGVITNSCAPALPAQLAINASFTCAVGSTAVKGQYENSALLTAHTADSTTRVVSDTDSSHYFGQDAGITVRVFTNGHDGVLPTGPIIVEGNPVTWTYLVNNTGNVQLTNIKVTDNPLGQVNCPQATLNPGANMTCTAKGIAVAGQYANTGTVVATPSVGSQVSDSNISHYFGAQLGVAIKKYVNEIDADSPPGLNVNIGDIVIWTYIVTNTSNVPLSISATDNKETLVGCEERVVAPGESYSCNAANFAIAGQYSNVGTARGTLLDSGAVVTATDSSYYFGKPLPPVNARLDFEKFTNGVGVVVPPGPFIGAGDVVTWTYGVINTGNITLTKVTVTDDKAGEAACASDQLAPQELVLCKIMGNAQVGQYTNTSTATATTSAGDVVSDGSVSSYFGEQPALAIKTFANGHDADFPTGPYVEIGQPVTFTFIVTNTGNVDVGSLVVTDTLGTQIRCPASALAVDASMTCTGNFIPAQPGQQSTLGRVIGFAPGGTPATASDPSNYFGADVRIKIQKRTNGKDADHAAGIVVRVDSPVIWTYVVTNTGNVPLTGVKVTDDHEGVINCPPATLAPGANTSCQRSSTAQEGLYANTATAVGTPPGGLADVQAQDDSHYFGARAALEFQKFTNGFSADSLPGPEIRAGTHVFWSYIVTNTGNVALDNMVVSDSQGVTVTCQSDILPVGGNSICDAFAIATVGPYSNTGEVSATFLGQLITATNDSHYTGIAEPPPAIPEVDIVKFTNDLKADTPASGPKVQAGALVTWTYFILNSGDITLTNVVVTDSDSSLVLTRISAGSGGDELLAPLEEWVYQATGIANEGPYENFGFVTASPFDNLALKVADNNASHYFGIRPEMVIKSFTNGQDADSAPGPFIAVGDPVIWTYVVTNTSNITVESVTVTDNKGVTVFCPKSQLKPDESMTCQADNATAKAGQYANVGTVAANIPLRRRIIVTASDPSHYFGAVTKLTLVKKTNNQDANLPPGPSIFAGDPVNWSYQVTNTANVTLTNVTMTDNHENVSANCPPKSLTVGASFICSKSSTAIAGQYDNQATVTASAPGGLPAVEATDDSHYFGVKLGLQINKSTNGEDADSTPGPIVDLGSLVRWTYVVTNTSNVPLDIAVTDDQGAQVECNPGETAPGDQLSCSAVGVARLGQYTNVGKATATYQGHTVNASDTSHYLGIDLPEPTDQDLQLKKLTNGVDADTGRGPLIQAGTQVTWTYIVANTGLLTMTNITVNDNPVGAVNCPQSTLKPRSGMFCIVKAVASVGPYSNTATAKATDGGGLKLVASDSSHYFGATPSVKITTLTNGIYAPQPQGPHITIGDPVVWTYFITNTGNVALLNVEVSDTQLSKHVADGEVSASANQAVSISCPQLVLMPQKSMTCQAGQGTAQSGQYANLGAVTAISPNATIVTDNSAGHYFGAEPTALEEAPQPGILHKSFMPSISDNR